MMKIIGCDFHPGYQQVVMWDKETGEVTEKALRHERKEEVRAKSGGKPPRCKEEHRREVWAPTRAGGMGRAKA